MLTDQYGHSLFFAVERSDDRQRVPVVLSGHWRRRLRGFLLMLLLRLRQSWLMILRLFAHRG
ncbi:hypothetical protein HY489_03265 [Candidatus Woesearchaeota archaeon]|nr:hypothetical protein [Candidatus Woesearchaeota archaeon]